MHHNSGDTSVSIIVNGSPQPIPSGASLESLLALLGFAGRPVAVEVDGEVVPRGSMASRHLAGGERIEIVTFVGGG